MFVPARCTPANVNVKVPEAFWYVSSAAVGKQIQTTKWYVVFATSGFGMFDMFVADDKELSEAGVPEPGQVFAEVGGTVFAGDDEPI